LRVTFKHFHDSLHPHMYNLWREWLYIHPTWYTGNSDVLEVGNSDSRQITDHSQLKNTTNIV